MTDDSVDRDDATLLGEILSLPPRLASRTIAQVQASQHLLGMLVCRGSDPDGAENDSSGADGGPDLPAGPESEAERRPTVEPVDVLSVLSREDDEDDHAEPGSPPRATESGDEAPTTPAPDVEDLPIPGYDSLAASQVVPRLTTLSADELESIGAYEAANRNRRTILNRVTQLQGK